MAAVSHGAYPLSHAYPESRTAFPESCSMCYRTSLVDSRVMAGATGRAYRSSKTQPYHVRIRISRSSGSYRERACMECKPSWYDAFTASPCTFHVWTELSVP